MSDLEPGSNGVIITVDDHPDLVAVLRHWMTKRPDMVEYVDVEDPETGQTYRLSGDVLRQRFEFHSEIDSDLLDVV